jgi:ATP sulfurylase
MTTGHEQAPGSIAPHGGWLVDRVARGAEAEELTRRAQDLPRVVLDERSRADLECIATGVLSPLEGFLRKKDYDRVVDEMRLADGTPFPIPITLSVPKADASKYGVGRDVSLALPDGTVVGVLHLEEKFDLDKPREARNVYKTEERAHPGVAWLYERTGDVALGGKVTMLQRSAERKFPTHHRDPIETRKLFVERGWRRVVAFQTRNPVHRAHEYLIKSALEAVDGLMLHPLVGETKSDDVPATTRVRCYEILLDTYFPKDRVLLSVFPFAMRYAGPREAVLHAIARQNYGCTHFIVGRDHAGVGNYYGSYDAHKIFDQFTPGELKITTLFFEHSFYCRGCQAVASSKTCPHEADQRLVLSGTKVRSMLEAGEAPPPEFSRPEVAKILIEAYRAAKSTATQSEAK